METIIGLLFILLPVIFKLIGKNFEQAGQTDKAGKMRELAEVFGSDDDSEAGSLKEWLERLNAPDSAETEPVVPVYTEPVPARQPEQVRTKAYRTEKTPVRPSVPLKKASLPKDDAFKKKEKIDPKKLVIYSEIMKPKFQ